MNKEYKTAFVSYSWDDASHQGWVMNLTNALRRKGVDSKIDLFVSQGGTVNLNTMMIKNVRDSDYIIIVLTENYANKADNFQGGVGFETILSLPLLQQHPEKLIFLIKHKGDFNAAFPFHLRGYYAIDFSNEGKFEEAFDELLHRIYEVPLYEMEPLGQKPDLTARVAAQKSVPKAETFFETIPMPNLKGNTDIDKIQYIEWSYQEINRLLRDMFQEIKIKNPDFHFISEKLSEKKHVYRLFVGDQLKTGLKIWLGNAMSSRSQNINLAYGTHFDYNSDNSMNDILTCVETDDKQLALSMMMNIMGNKGPHDPKGIVVELWKHHLSNQLK